MLENTILKCQYVLILFVRDEDKFSKEDVEMAKQQYKKMLGIINH